MCASAGPVIQRVNRVFERLQVADEQVAFAMPVWPFFRPAHILRQWLKQNAVYADFFGPLHKFSQLRHGFPHQNTDQRDANCGPLAFNPANHFGYHVVEPRGSAITIVNNSILPSTEKVKCLRPVFIKSVVTVRLKGQTIRDEVDREPEMNGPAEDVVDSRFNRTSPPTNRTRSVRVHACNSSSSAIQRSAGSSLPASRPPEVAQTQRQLQRFVRTRATLSGAASPRRRWNRNCAPSGESRRRPLSCLCRPGSFRLCCFRGRDPRYCHQASPLGLRCSRPDLSTRYTIEILEQKEKH